VTGIVEGGRRAFLVVEVRLPFGVREVLEIVINYDII
jgi:hypothetical protein